MGHLLKLCYPAAYDCSIQMAPIDGPNCLHCLPIDYCTELKCIKPHLRIDAGYPQHCNAWVVRGVSVFAYLHTPHICHTWTE